LLPPPPFTPPKFQVRSFSAFSLSPECHSGSKLNVLQLRRKNIFDAFAKFCFSAFECIWCVNLKEALITLNLSSHEWNYLSISNVSSQMVTSWNTLSFCCCHRCFVSILQVCFSALLNKGNCEDCRIAMKTTIAQYTFVFPVKEHVQVIVYRSSTVNLISFWVLTKWFQMVSLPPSKLRILSAL